MLTNLMHGYYISAGTMKKQGSHAITNLKCEDKSSGKHVIVWIHL